MDSQDKKQHLCSRCVNWLELNPGEATCDYDMFVDEPLDKAELYIPELFDCQEFELVKD